MHNLKSDLETNPNEPPSDMDRSDKRDRRFMFYYH